MRWLVLAIVGALLWSCQTGCGPTMTETPAKRSHDYQHAADLETRMLREDIETFLLMDHPSHLTRWQVE